MKKKSLKIEELPEEIVSPITGDILKKYDLESEFDPEEESIGYYTFSVGFFYNFEDSPSWWGDVWKYENEETGEVLFIPCKIPKE